MGCHHIESVLKMLVWPIGKKKGGKIGEGLNKFVVLVEECVVTLFLRCNLSGSLQASRVTESRSRRSRFEFGHALRCSAGDAAQVMELYDLRAVILVQARRPSVPSSHDVGNQHIGREV